MFNVSPQTIRHEWLIPKRTIPLTVFDKLSELAALKNKEEILKNSKIFEPFWGQKIAEDKLKIKKVNLPSKFDLDFAEFYGILLGDGCIFSNLRGLSITGNQITDYFY